MNRAQALSVLDEVLAENKVLRDHRNHAVREANRLGDERDAVVKALRAFVKKHGQGGAKRNREDYVVMVPAADIYALVRALEETRWP